MKESKFEKIMIVVILLMIGFFGGILFSTYNLQITDIKNWDTAN